MRKKDILHIYAGSAGSAGSYIRELFLGLQPNFDQELVVNYYYPLSYGDAKRRFYRFSELSSPFKYRNKKIRLIIRYFELLFTLLYSYIYLISHKVSVLNYNLTSDLFVEYLFLKIVKVTTKTKVLITCHDVVPFGTDDELGLKKKILRKKMFFDLADFLIVHNESSKHDLQKHFQITDNIIQYPFPVMSLRTDNPLKKKSNGVIKFGMIGHIRNEKGLDVLIDAWRLFYKPDKNVELIIAGNFATSDAYDLSTFNGLSIKVIPSFLSDERYKQLIEELDVVILPYKRGTNSGIPSSVISLDSLLLTSDIPMFKCNPLIPLSFQFESKNAISLAEKMNWLCSLTEEERQSYRSKNTNQLINYRGLFIETTNQVYSNLINNNKDV
ncbi:glycosyltransferase [Marinifilum fragile]|uniref:glycosyltransferase n=1 Tax=Marinifilum fragile TaxID=570161 RepID=UPI002AA79B74|nr:glycosyltransferase [Marinifilum fragile]